MKLKKPNAAQWSLIAPGFSVFCMTSLLGTQGYVVMPLALLATPIIFIAFSKEKNRPLWRKTGIACALTGTSLFTSLFAGGIGFDAVFKIRNPSSHKAESDKMHLEMAQSALEKKEKESSSSGPGAIETLPVEDHTVCKDSKGSYIGMIAGSSCEGAGEPVTSAPSIGFLGMNKKRLENYNLAVKDSIDKTKQERERQDREAAQRRADLEKWGPFFADFEVREQAKKMCNDYAFSMTKQKQSWFFDDRTDFDIRVVGNRVWVGGPITVKVKDGNIDGSDFRYQKGVDCYWSKNATSLEGGKITVE